MLLAGRARRNVPLYLFCHHKTGTNLLLNIFRDICKRKRWKMVTVRYYVKVPPDADVVLFQNSTIDPAFIDHPYRGVHMIRDPREVIVSGYFYHKKTNEKWCINQPVTLTDDGDSSPVPMFMQHIKGEWLDQYIDDLDGLSYQEKLNSMSQDEGLKFEISHMAKWTIRNMLAWDYSNSLIYETKMEDVRSDFDKTFLDIFEHFNFTQSEKKLALKLACRHDLRRASSKKIKENSHVRTNELFTWQKHLKKSHFDLLKSMCGENVLSILGY